MFKIQSVVLVASLAVIAAFPLGKCSDAPAGTGSEKPAELVTECVKCMNSAKIAGCATPLYCPAITGSGGCGNAAYVGVCFVAMSLTLRWCANPLF
jgi:hypothetical protein